MSAFEQCLGNLKKWDKKTVINIENTTNEVEEIINKSPKDFRNLSLDKMEEVLMMLSQYSLFLTNELNKASSNSRVCKIRFDNHLSQVFLSLKIEGKSKDERILMARRSDEKLDSLYNKYEEYEINRERLQNLPMSINIKNSIYRDIYKRKAHEYEQSKKSRS